MRLPTAEQLTVRRLGPGRRRSPMRADPTLFVDDARVLVSADSEDLEPFLGHGRCPPAFEIAGPRPRLHFDPDAVRAGVVTCGGLCPGLNNVIRGIVLTLWHQYGVREILGFRYGYEGLSRTGNEPAALTPSSVDGIQHLGGTVLGTSRGPQDLDDMVDGLVERDVRILLAIGGDGTLRGASALAQRLLERGVDTAVVGIPKTIDNDIAWVMRSFGFTTAVHAANVALASGHTECHSTRRGIGLVKLMGRHSGFIAATASLANTDVNFCLIPEAPVPIDGETGLLRAIERRLELRDHALIAVAEGFGQEHCASDGDRRDASGNRKLGEIGLWLRDRIVGHFDSIGQPITMKYIDPSYLIRSIPATSLDAELCLALGQHGVHAGMAGYTDVMIGFWNQRFTHVPIPTAVQHRRHVDPHDPLWQRVLASTGQGSYFAPGAPASADPHEPTEVSDPTQESPR